MNVWFESESQEFNPQAGIIAFEMVIGVRYGRTPNGERAKEAADKVRMGGEKTHPDVSATWIA